jgi:hypothetical protein
MGDTGTNTSASASSCAKKLRNIFRWRANHDS